MTQAHPHTAKPGAGQEKKPGGPSEERPVLNAVGQPEPGTGEPVPPFAHPDRPVGERQDGAGAGLRREDRHDALPAGDTAARRAGAGQGQPEEPDARHRGHPAALTSGAASGSGSGAGGGGTGPIEEPDPDSTGGGGREPGFSHLRPFDGRKHGGR